MANRHERRRAAKVGEVRYISLEELTAMPWMCAWDGCTASAMEPHKHGWSSMILYKGEPQLNFEDIDPRRMARDCVLCPEHARYLDEHLLMDNNGRMRETAGTA